MAVPVVVVVVVSVGLLSLGEEDVVDHQGACVLVRVGLHFDEVVAQTCLVPVRVDSLIAKRTELTSV